MGKPRHFGEPTRSIETSRQGRHVGESKRGRLEPPAVPVGAQRGLGLGSCPRSVRPDLGSGCQPVRRASLPPGDFEPQAFRYSDRMMVGLRDTGRDADRGVHSKCFADVLLVARQPRRWAASVQSGHYIQDRQHRAVPSWRRLGGPAASRQEAGGVGISHRIRGLAPRAPRGTREFPRKALFLDLPQGARYRVRLVFLLRSLSEK